MNIGDKIKMERSRLGLSQLQLSEIVGVARVTITDWENSKTKPKGEYIIPLALGLGISVYHLLDSSYPRQDTISEGVAKLELDLLAQSIADIDSATKRLTRVLSPLEKAEAVVGRYKLGHHPDIGDILDLLD